MYAYGGTEAPLHYTDEDVILEVQGPSIREPRAGRIGRIALLWDDQIGLLLMLNESHCE